MARLFSLRMWLLATAGLLCLGGCGGGGSGVSVITRKPAWAFDKYQRLAVLETKYSDPRARQAAEHLTARLTELLTNNGAFTVVEKERFRDIMTEQDLSKLADVANPDTALPEGAIEVAQVLVLPALTTFELKATRAERRQPVWGVDSRGRPVQRGERIVMEYTHGARVSGTVRVVDAATGRTLLSHSIANAGDETSALNTPPDESPDDIATAAVDGMADEFYKRIAPTQMELEFDRDMLIVATGYYDGRYETVTKVPWGADKLLIAAVGLPPEAQKNEFRLELATVRSKEVLGAESFTWAGTNGKRGVVLEVPGEKLKQTDETEFVAKLFAEGDDEPVLTQVFTLERPKQ